MTGGDMGAFEAFDEPPVVLVAEDEELVAHFVEDVLGEAGFRAVSTTSGEEALSLLIGERDKYRVLLTDVRLTGRSDGWAVARRAREINPDLPIVYMTGAAANQWPSQGVPNSILLTKPFAPAQLVTAVSQLLNTGLPPALPN
jgi:CheY-like chemotaxis protein